MSGGHLIHFESLGAGITAIETFLAKAEDNGRNTVESLNCWYVQPCSANWLDTVLRTKAAVEGL